MIQGILTITTGTLSNTWGIIPANIGLQVRFFVNFTWNRDFTWFSVNLLVLCLIFRLQYSSPSAFNASTLFIRSGTFFREFFFTWKREFFYVKSWFFCLQKPWQDPLEAIKESLKSGKSSKNVFCPFIEWVFVNFPWNWNNFSWFHVIFSFFAGKLWMM